MDPLTLATSFATIVSLLGSYSSERSSERSSSFDDFMKWLAERHHQELVELIQQSDTTLLSVKVLLNQKHEVLDERLKSLDEAMAQIAYGFSEFRGVALLAHPQIELSDQAITLLKEFCDSDASTMFEIRALNGALYQFSDGKRGSFVPSDPRFFDDDLRSLVSLGLLHEKNASDKRREFQITRSAAKYVEAIRGSK